MTGYSGDTISVKHSTITPGVQRTNKGLVTIESAKLYREGMSGWNTWYLSATVLVKEKVDIEWYLHLYDKDKTYLCTIAVYKHLEPDAFTRGYAPTLPLQYDINNNYIGDEEWYSKVYYCTISEDPDEPGEIFYSRD